MRKTVLLIAVLLVVLGIPGLAYANYYGVDLYYGSTGLDGSFYRATIKALDAKWTAGNDNFILHTQWLHTDANRSWIEVGFLDGEWIPSQTYYRGYYAAQYVLDAEGGILAENYKQISGPSTALDTTHTFQIQRDGTSTWGVYVDGILRQTWTSGSGSVGAEPAVGVESNNTTSTSALWNERSLQVYKNGVWSYWTSGTLSQSGTARCSWDVQPTSILTCQY